MTGNEEKKRPLGRGPALHSSQCSLCASELEKCAHGGSSRCFKQTWSTTFLGWHRSGGPGMILRCPKSKNLRVFLGVIICTLLSLWKEDIRGTRGFPAHKNEVLMDMDPECGGSLKREQQRCLSSKFTKAGNLHNKCKFHISPNLSGFFFFHVLSSSGHLRLAEREKRNGKWEALKENWMTARQGSKKLTKAGEITGSSRTECDKNQRSHKTPLEYHKEMEKDV